MKQTVSSHIFESLRQDIRYSVRIILKNPGFSLIAILTLALGIGANTAIYSVVYGILLQPLPYHDPEKLLRISTDWNGAIDGGVSGPEYLDYKEQVSGLQSIGLHSSLGTMNVSFGSGGPERVPRVLVTSSVFQVLGVKAYLGRTFLAQEDVPGNHRVLLLSYGLWQRRFGNDKNIIGKVVDVHGIPHTIIGVMPPGFAFPTKETGAWRPFGIDLSQRPRSARNLRVVARAKADVSISAVQAEMNAIARQLQKKYPVEYPQGSGFAPHVYSLREYLVGSLRTPLFVLFAAVGFVLLIACTNVANLILARTGARRKELAIRAALGAGRRRLLRQAITESILLSLLGGALALLLAYGGLKVLIASSPENIPRLGEVSIEPRVFAFTFLISFVTGIAVGFGAAWSFYSVDANQTLKEGSRDSQPSGSKKLRATLVISEVALACALLLAAGLLIRSFLKLQQIDPGVRPRGVITATVSLLHLRYQDPQTQVQFFLQLIERISQRPSVVSVAAVGNAPFSGWYDDQAFAIEGRKLKAPGLYPDEETRLATPGYFRTIGIPLLKGRDFTKEDRAGSVPVAIISDLLARKHWPTENPIGKRIKLGGDESDSPWSTIIGIVGDVHHGGLTNEIRPILYLSFAQVPDNTMTLVVRSNQDPLIVAGVLRSTTVETDPGLPLYDVRTLDDAISKSLAQPRFTFRLLGLFAFLALVLASVGIYGAFANSVIQRTSEIGVRMALGASRLNILWMVCGDGLRLVAIGLTLGIAAATALSRLLTSLLFGFSPFDPAIYLSVAILIAVVAFFAVIIPARRAIRVDPLEALRYQ